MAQEDASVPRSQGLCRLDELQVAHGEHLPAYEPGVPWPPHERRGQHALRETCAECGGERDGKYQRRETEEQLGDSHEDEVEPTAEVTRDEADDAPDQTPQDHHRQSRAQGIASAEEDAAQDVATQLVVAHR